MINGDGLTFKMAAGTPLPSPQFTEGKMPIEKTDYFQLTTEDKKSKLVSIGELTDSLVNDITSRLGVELTSLNENVETVNTNFKGLEQSMNGIVAQVEKQFSAINKKIAPKK